MATDPPPTSASAAFPAPPPFYKSFTPANLALLEASTSSVISTPSSTQPSSALPPALQHLTPPPPPLSGTYRCFGVSHTVNSAPIIRRVLLCTALKELDPKYPVDRSPDDYLSVPTTNTGPPSCADAIYSLNFPFPHAHSCQLARTLRPTLG